MSRWEEIVDNIKTPERSEAAAIFVYITHISLKYDYMFVETPKSGCSSIKTTLINAELRKIIEHDDFEYLHIRKYSPLLNPMQVGDFVSYIEDCRTKFCFVRNPYSRVLSCFLDKIVPVNAYRRIDLMKKVGIEEEGEVSFENFVDYICNQETHEMDPHWRLQFDLTCFDHIKYDFIGRFENFDQDLRCVMENIGIDHSLYYRSEMRHATAASAKIDEYYNENIKAKIYEKFSKDFDTFGYEK